jgi:pantoate--beta-alanine ligase
MVLRQMVRQLAMPIEIMAGETTRSDVGLALSSRNGYLSTAEKDEALSLSQTLRQLLARWQAGERDIQALEAEAMAHLSARGWQPDSVVLRRQHDLGAPLDHTPLVALAAAKLGATRLIDNLELAAPAPLNLNPP